jgi:hypothetical protein
MQVKLAEERLPQRIVVGAGRSLLGSREWRRATGDRDRGR